MNIPNILTILRIFLSLFFAVFLCKEGIAFKFIAILLFTLASITDFLDGYIARKYNLVSNFGKIMDPIADKFLTLIAFYIFARMHIIAVWMFIAIAFREIIITIWRIFIIRKGKVLAAEYMGKYKTVFQMVSIYVILLFIIFRETTRYLSVNIIYINIWEVIIYALMFISVALTLISGVFYFMNNRKV